LAGYYNTFIVRVWYDETGKPQRGHIQRTGTSEQAYFNKLEDIAIYIQSRSGKPRTNEDRLLPPVSWED